MQGISNIKFIEKTQNEYKWESIVIELSADKGGY